MKLAQMHDTVATVTVDWFGEPVEAEVRPGRLTGDLIFASEDAATEWDGLQDQIMALVSRWDVVDEDGKELPVSPESIRMVPTLFLAAVVRASVEQVSQQGRG